MDASPLLRGHGASWHSNRERRPAAAASHILLRRTVRRRAHQHILARWACDPEARHIPGQSGRRSRRSAALCLSTAVSIAAADAKSAVTRR